MIEYRIPDVSTSADRPAAAVSPRFPPMMTESSEARRPEAARAAAGAGAAVPERKLLLPSLFDLVFGLWAAAMLIIAPHRLMHADGDAARHIRMGEHMLETRGRVTEDIFSHTAFGEPFLSYEWLSQLFFGSVHQAGGVAAVTIATVLVLTLSYALLLLFLQRRGVDPLLAVLVVVAAAVLGSDHWAARPHIFTFLGTAVLLLLIDGRSHWNLVRFGLLFALWANLHPGFLFGLGLLAVILAGDLAEVRWGENRREWLERARFHAAALAVALAATMLNPFGWDLHTHILGHLNDDYLLAFTNEFRSPDFHAFFGRAFMLAVLAAFGAALVTPRRLPFPTLFVLFATVALALNAQRNISLFAFTAVPLVAAGLYEIWRQRSPRMLRRVRRVLRDGDARARQGWWTAIVAAALVLVALNSGRVAGTEIVPNRFDPAVFPVEAVEQARAAGITGTLFNHFVWGGYLVYAWREQPIFIDGMTDHFGADLAREYLRIALLAPGWREAMAGRHIDLVLVPADGRLAYELDRDPDWNVWYRDRLAVLMVSADREDLPAPPADGGEAP